MAIRNTGLLIAICICTSTVGNAQETPTTENSTESLVQTPPVQAPSEQEADHPAAPSVEGESELQRLLIVGFVTTLAIPMESASIAHFVESAARASGEYIPVFQSADNVISPNTSNPQQTSASADPPDAPVEPTIPLASAAESQTPVAETSAESTVAEPAVAEPPVAESTDEKPTTDNGCCERLPTLFYYQ